MKKLVIVGAILIAIAAYFLYFVPAPKKTKVVHFHAGFAVYVDGVKQDFSDNKYMHLEPCTVTGTVEKLSATQEQLEKAHLHENVGDVVHVHRDNALWLDLFKNIRFAPPQKPLQGYLNGKKADNILNMPIHAYDSALFIFGDDKNVDKTRIITKEYIQSVEKKTESC